jgi:hypothetical protein
VDRTERNGAIKAINACQIAMRESGEHKVSLDQVIRTMLQTGRDTQSRCKELHLVGLPLTKSSVETRRLSRSTQNCQSTVFGVEVTH